METQIQHPDVLDLLPLSPGETARLGFTDGMLRLSVGIEDEADLRADLEGGFQAAGQIR